MCHRLHDFAPVSRDSSPDAAFPFLSGSGADPTGRSWLAFARYKGQAEKVLLAVGFPRVYLFPTRLQLPRGAAQGTEFQLPTDFARSIPFFGCCSLTR
jgi:uncharacterized protein YbjT (DUF2867 family)